MPGARLGHFSQEQVVTQSARLILRRLRHAEEIHVYIRLASWWHAVADQLTFLSATF